jgi:hypothetical protein
MWSDNEADIDLLRFSYLSSTVTRLVQTPELLPLSIGIFSDWGGGKSTLLKLVQAELAKDEEILCLNFNGWLFEGYEDAKSALMGTILEAIEDRAKKQQPLSERGSELLKKLLARVNWMQVAGLGLRVGVPALLGMPDLSLASVLGELAGTVRALPGMLRDKAATFDPEDAKKLIKDAPGGADQVRRNIRDFRKDFAELLIEAKIKTLVVFIDDLDRCIPDTIIETLEAIKLFLFVKGTAFVLAADEHIVQYAVRRRFPELPNSEREVGRDYLEKLIQIPIRIPPLSGADAWSYMNMLFAERCLEADAYAAVCKHAANFKPTGIAERAFDLPTARQIFGDAAVPQQLQADLDLITQIAPVLIPGLGGNPRRIKRFLNMLLLRLEMGESRGLDLQRRVMAKLMLLEYLKPIFFRQLARLQASQDGKPRELAVVEFELRRSADERKRVAEPKPTDGKGNGDVPRGRTKEVNAPAVKSKDSSKASAVESTDSAEPSAEIATWQSDTWMVEKWLASEPALANVDLRPYFYIAHDIVGVLVAGQARLSPAAAEVLNKLLGVGEATHARGIKLAGELGPPDITAVFEALAERIRQAESLGEGSLLSILFQLVRTRSDLLPQLVALCGELPEPKLTMSTPILLMEAVDGSSSEQGARETIRRWTTSENENLANGSKVALDRMSK